MKEEKLDKILDNQQKLAVTQGVIIERLENKKEILDKNTKDIENLKKFKWGIVGTATVSLVTFFKTLFT